MIYHKICPHCQELCKAPAEAEYYVYSGSCFHTNPTFKYSFIEFENSVIIDIVAEEVYAMIQVDSIKKSSSRTFLKTKSGEVILEGCIPFDWNTFEIDSFIKKVKKISEMKTFT